MEHKHIIFIHGFPFNHQCWNSQVEHFKPLLNVHTPDLRGHGKSASPPGPWMIHHFADDLLLFMNENKIEKAVICGLSMGGYVALHFVIEFPERVSALVLCDTRADADSNEAKDKRYVALKRVAENDYERFVSEFCLLALSKSSRYDEGQLKAQIESIALQNDPKNMALAIGALASRRDSQPYLDKIKCPVLVLVGEEDEITPPEINEAISKKISGCMFHKIEKAGHLSNMEQPETFNRYVEEFIS